MKFRIKKEDIPDELPNLGISEIKEKPSEKAPSAVVKTNEGKLKPQETVGVLGEGQILPKKEVISEKEEISFFKSMLGDIEGEINDLNKLDSLSRHKMIPKDIVAEMKKYWEKQKPGQIIEIIGKDFKENLMKKLENLGKLEKEWRAISLQLIIKEEEIRKEEKEMKNILAEFVKACKEKIGPKKSNHNENHKKKK